MQIKNLKSNLDEILQEFAGLENWQQKYEKLIQIGKNSPKLETNFKIDKYKISGCQSRVWLKAELNNEGKIIFTGESDAMIVQGILTLLIANYSELTPTEILNTEPLFLQKLNLLEYLSAVRSNGLQAILKQIQNYALAFLALEKTGTAWVSQAM